MKEFFKIYGTIIIATVALIQPWLVALWKKYFRQGKIEIYQTGNIEIGYSAFGPTIGLNGTLRCLNRDLFVQKIYLELIKEKDSSTHIFEWGVFRTEKLTIEGNQQASLELPSGFMSLTSVPYRYNIQFHDLLLQSEMRPIINNVKEKWSKKITEIDKTELMRLLSQNLSLPVQLQDPFGPLYDTFSRSSTHVEAFGSLNQLYYWEEGIYSLKMTARTSKPDKLFGKKWQFTLNKEEVKIVRLNVLKLLQDTCNRPSFGPYFFAYPKYE